MFFFKKKTQISEQKVRELIQRLEAAYTEKDIEKLKELFHPDHREISFLNHFTLMMNFQIYNIQSDIIKIEILDLSEDEATFTYTRKHIYTCINKNDENGESPNNITSYYIQVKKEANSIWITRFSKYSELFLDEEGEIFPHEKEAVPSSAQFYNNMKRFIEPLQLDGSKPATYLLYDNSEFIGYYPENERFSYKTTEKFTIDYFTEMGAASVEEHTERYLRENSLEHSEVIKMEENYSLIETKFISNSLLQHELVLSMLAPDGFFMIRYLKNNNSPIKKQRQSWIDQMAAVTAYINSN